MTVSDARAHDRLLTRGSHHLALLIRNQQPPPLPPSCTHSAINAVGLACSLVALFLMRLYGPVEPFGAALIGMAAWTVPILLLEWMILKTYRRASTGLTFAYQHPWNWERIFIKFLGLIVTLAAAALVYGVLPEYRHSRYEMYWKLLWFLLPVLACGSLPYIAWVDRRMVQPEDGYWHAGLAVLGRWRSVDRRCLGQHALGWVVKAFFLPLMFTSLAGNMNRMQHMDGSRLFSVFNACYEIGWTGLFTVDLLIVSVGYLLTLRITDSHIRSTEPTALGWGVALACYEPFWTLLEASYLRYDDELSWKGWLGGHAPALIVGWGSAILLLLAIYVWASAQFGVRFSNLTHRGILTNGPYRWTKHPAYVSKNLLWWLVSVPFLSPHGGWEAAGNCLRLLLVNVVYVLRARTEERHLSRDPVYMAYALAMNERSLFRPVARLLPFLRYRHPHNLLQKSEM